MELFGRKFAKTPARGEASDGLVRLDARGAPYHRLTLGLSRAENIAIMLAKSRAARMVEVADLLAGIYMQDWERLSKYWKDEDHEKIESYLRQICRISPQRWHFWIQDYHNQQNPVAGWRKWRALERLPGEDRPAEFLRRSSALIAVMKAAESIAPSHDAVDGENIPILSSECVLLSIARDSDSEISRKLAETGMDLAALARDATFPKHAPLD